MTLFISKNGSGEIEGVVFAKSMDIATAYFYGKHYNSHTITEITQEELDNHEFPLMKVITTREVDVYNLSKSSKIRLIEKS